MNRIAAVPFRAAGLTGYINSILIIAVYGGIIICVKRVNPEVRTPALAAVSIPVAVTYGLFGIASWSVPVLKFWAVENARCCFSLFDRCSRGFSGLNRKFNFQRRFLHYFRPAEVLYQADRQNAVLVFNSFTIFICRIYNGRNQIPSDLNPELFSISGMEYYGYHSSLSVISCFR